MRPLGDASGKRLILKDKTPRGKRLRTSFVVKLPPACFQGALGGVPWRKRLVRIFSFLSATRKEA